MTIRTCVGSAYPASIYRSMDGGKSWQQCALPDDVPVIGQKRSSISLSPAQAA